MIVNLVSVFLHLACQCGSDFAAAGFTSQMRCVSIELPFEINKHRSARREFLVDNGLLKFRVAFVYLGVERGGIEAFTRYGELVDKCEFKISQTFDACIASAFTESRSTTTRDGNYRSAEKCISNDEIFRGSRIHKTRVVRLSILRLLAFACQDLKGLERGHLLFGCLLQRGRIIEQDPFDHRDWQTAVLDQIIVELTETEIFALSILVTT
jgi:hypothetical protein